MTGPKVIEIIVQNVCLIIMPYPKLKECRMEYLGDQFSVLYYLSSI